MLNNRQTRKTSHDDLDFQEFFSTQCIVINPVKTALKLSLVYIAIGIIWILLSDRLLELLIKDMRQLHLLQTYKGCLYIFITGAFLFLRVKKSLVRIQLISGKLSESYEELNLAYEELIAAKEDLKSQFEELKLSEEALAESKERYKLAVKGSKDAIWDLDLKNNKQYISTRLREILGYEDPEFSYDFNTLLHPDDRDKALKVFNDYLNKKIDVYVNTYRLKAENGEYKWILSRGQAIWDRNGKAIRMAGSKTDITEQKRYEERILNLAYYDLITKLPNRAMLEKELNSRIIQAKYNNTKFALLYLDLDDFKNVNDTLGHAYGDKLLKMIANEFVKHKKESDILARLGGDEFALLVSDVREVDQVHSLANEFIESLNKPWVLNSQEFYISTSIGVAIFPEHGNSFDALLKNADTAMYSAKENGKKSYKIYEKEMYMRKIESINMEKSLRCAVKNNEFVLNYQSMVDLKKDQIIGAETLIRWQHPHKGLILPVNFISTAEKTGVIKEIGKWTIDTACRQNKIWINKGYRPIKLSINMSALEFRQHNLVENIKNTLDKIELDSKNIVFEITENTALKDLDYTIKILNKLKVMNIQIALDDFGTGYSSLNYLRILPIDYLKLDKSFIKNIATNAKDQAITKYIIDLAHEIDLKVVAEGIETEEQYNYLKKINCDIGQGYFFGRPSLEEEFEKVLK